MLPTGPFQSKIAAFDWRVLLDSLVPDCLVLLDRLDRLVMADPPAGADTLVALDSLRVVGEPLVVADALIVPDTLVVLDTPCPLSFEVIFSYYSTTTTSFILIIDHRNLTGHDTFHIHLIGKQLPSESECSLMIL